MKVSNALSFPVLVACLLIASCQNPTYKERSISEELAVNHKDKPNIILINVDDISAKELATYGGPMKLPAIEQLAKEGVQFQTAWASPQCGPTRAMLLTGTYPHTNGYLENQVLPEVSFLKDSAYTLLIPTMRASGYACGMFGKMHHERNLDPAIYQVDDYCLWKYWEGQDGPNHRYWHPSLVADGEGIKTNKTDFGPEIVFEHLLKFIHKNTESNQPFFAYCPAILAHQEKRVNSNEWFFPDMPKINDMGQRVEGTVPGTLYSMMKYQDHLVGRLVDHLEEQGVLENTIIMFTADNGTPGYGKGKYENEYGLRVPFIVAHGGVKKHGLSEVMIDFTDVLPTLAEIGGYPQELNTDGHSFARYLFGDPKWEEREYLRMSFMNTKWIRSRDWLIDGLGHFYDCRGTRNESEYQHVTYAEDPAIKAKRGELQQLWNQIPEVDKSSPVWGKTKKKFAEVYIPEEALK